MNQSWGPGVSLGGPAMFRPPMDDETKLGPDETIFGLGEDGRKLRWLQVHPTKRRAAKAHDRGPS